MKHTLILSAAVLLGVIIAHATTASASEVVGTLYMGAPTAQTGTLASTVTGAPSAGGSASGGGGTPLGGGVIGLSGSGEATNAFLVLTPVVNASGTVLGASTYEAPVTYPSANRAARVAQGVDEDGVVTLATLQDTSNETYSSVASVATGAGLQQWAGGLLLLLIILGLGYYLYTQSGRRRRQLP